MNRIPLLFVTLLAVPTLASAAPAPVKTAPPAVHPDLLSSVRSHVAALGRQPLASPGVSIRTPQAAPPVFDSPQPSHLATVIAAAPVNGRR